MKKTEGFTQWFLPLAVGIVIGASFHQVVRLDPVPSGAVPRAAVPEFRLMAEAWNAINQQYVDRSAIQPKTLAYGAISGMVEALGDTGHSVFMPPELVKTEQSLESGNFAGIGAELQVKNEQLVVVAPMDGSPAQKAGVRPGDIIISVDGRKIAGLPLQQVVGQIKGPAGTRVSLTLKDPLTGKERAVVITRAKIPLRSVTWRRLPGTELAHVRIAFFSKGTSKDLEAALAEIEQSGVKGIVLDLRNDPGGLLDMAVAVASQFLQQGSALLEKDAHGAVRAVPLETGVKKCDLPLVVLINEGSASASEIVAGALQDARRATLVGKTTFGTGTVLKTIPLSDGSALQLAFLEWLTPKGRVIWHKGIMPDITVSLPDGVSPLVPEAETGLTRAQLPASRDRQLLRAVELLQKKTVSRK